MVVTRGVCLGFLALSSAGSGGLEAAWQQLSRAILASFQKPLPADMRSSVGLNWVADAHQVRNGLSKKPAEAWGQPERLVCHASRLVCAAEPIVSSSQKENGFAVAWMLLDKLREAARSKLPFLLAEGKECQIELSFRPGWVRFEGTRATPSWPQRHPRRQRRMRRGSPERHRSEAALKRSERLVVYSSR